MGFSPFWNMEFVYYTAILFEANFRANLDGEISWQNEAVEETIDYFRQWLGEVNEGFEREAAFREKYINIPEYRLLAEDRILFYLTDVKSFFKIPQEKREGLDFRWLARNGRIPVLENVLFAGMPRAAKNPKGGMQLLAWIFRPQTQVRLMEINRFKRLQGVFGIANGFSSLKQINERDLPQPQRYPFFLGHIPTPDMLHFPDVLPQNWELLKKTVVIPWLSDSISSERTAISLKTRLGLAND